MESTTVTITDIDTATKKSPSANVMKRADQRSSITILLLGDGTYVPVRL
jgi:hypothetical protein